MKPLTQLAIPLVSATPNQDVSLQALNCTFLDEEVQHLEFELIHFKVINVFLSCSLSDWVLLEWLEAEDFFIFTDVYKQQT